MKANRIKTYTGAMALALMGVPLCIAGCSHSDPNTPTTVAQQKADLQGPGQIPPDVLAKARAMYGQNGSYTQKVQTAQGAAGAAKQAASGQAQAQQPQQAPALH